MERLNSGWLRSAFRSSEFRAVAVIILFLAALIVGSYQALLTYDSTSNTPFIEFLKGVQVETVGLLFDTILFGLLIYVIRHRDESERTRDRNLEILDDFRTWGSEEATFRITGALRRLSEHETKFKLAGLCLTNVSLVERGIRDISGSSFSEVGRETKLRAVSFREVVCQSVRFSESSDSANPITDADSTKVYIENRVELIAGLRKKIIPEELIQKIEKILKDNDALDNSDDDRVANFVQSLDKKEYVWPDDRPVVRRALEVLARLSQPVCFEGIDLGFEKSKLGDARFEGARLIWSSNRLPFVGAEAGKLSFKNATIINANFSGFSILDGLDLDGAWFYPGLPGIGATIGKVSNVDTARVSGFVSEQGTTVMDLQLDD